MKIDASRLPRSPWVYFGALIALVVIFTAVAACSKKPTIKLQRLWTYEWDRWKNCEPGINLCREREEYFSCDYTSQTCQSGYKGGGTIFLFVLLANDRKTEIAHRFCIEGTPVACLSFDTGEVSSRMPGRVLDDMPESCVDFTRDRNSRLKACSEWISLNVPEPVLADALEHLP
jgi:hypothetical protein